MSSTSVTLANGLSMPLIGLGTFQTQDPQTVLPLLRAALDIGYRHIDTALAYNNHKVLGDALA
jgi:diketogulonate reductase-like aldo/keto reductase